MMMIERVTKIIVNKMYDPNSGTPLAVDGIVSTAIKDHCHAYAYICFALWAYKINGDIG